MASFVPRKKQVAQDSQQTIKNHNVSDELSKGKPSQPDDLIIVARIGVAYGVKGWVKIHPFSHSPEALMNAQNWWIAPYIPNQSEHKIQWQHAKPTQIKPHSDSWVAHCDAWVSRTEAELIKGWQVAVARADFPEPESDEFYWVDLMDAHVINQDGVVLGQVYSLIENAAHTVMQIRSLPTDSERAPTEYLIPFVAAFVGEVDVKSTPKTIAVTWDVDATA